MSELRNRLKGLILLYIGLSITISCSYSQYQQNVAEPLNISKRYYITKNPEKKDEAKLKEIIAKSSNLNQKSEAGVLLGGYYYKINKTEKSEKYLNKYLKDTQGDVKAAGSLWLASILKAKGNDQYRKIVKELTGDESLTNFLINKSCEKGQRFCLSKIPIKGTNVDSGKKGTNIIKKRVYKPIQETVRKEQVKPVDITVVNGNYDNEAFKGIILAASTDNKTEINVHAAQNTEYTINVSDQKVLFKESMIDFKINYRPAIEKISEIIGQDMCDNIIVGVNDKFVDEGSYAKALLIAKNYNVQLENFETEAFKSLRYKFDNKADATQCFVGIGTEEQMTEFVPLVRYISPNPDVSKIYIITDIYTGKYEHKDFINYFKNVEILTFISPVNNKGSNEFLHRFQDIYSKTPGSKAFIGYDMVKYLQKAVRGKDVNYVSSIEGVENGRITRKIYPLTIGNNLKVKVTPLNDYFDQKTYRGF